MYFSKIKRTISVLLLTAVILSSFTINVFAQYGNTHHNTGDERTDIIGVAKTQIGYTENSDGSTKYGQFLKTSETQWSAAFIAWCAYQAQIAADIIPFDSSPLVFKEFFENNSCYYRSAAYGGGYTPFAGDIVFFSSSGSLINISSVGLVTGADEESVYVVEGDSDDAVKSTAYSLTDKIIVGYASPKYNQNYPGVTVKPEPSSESLYLVADISKWNDASKFKWDKFKDDGVQGIIIRIAGRGYGDAKSLYEDTAFLANYNAAKQAGLHIGVYFYSYALTEAQALEEAELTISMLKKENIELDMPVFIDIEDYSESDYTDRQHYYAGKAVCSMVVNTFCDAVKEAGYYPGIYCNKNFAETLLEPSVFTNRATWIAQYGVSKCGYNGSVDMWQYTKSGKITAFSGSIDLSYCYTDFPSVISAANTLSGYYGEHIISDDWQITVPPSCETTGERVKTCVDCGKVLVTEKLPSSHTESAENVMLNTDINAGDTLTTEQLFSLHSSEAGNYDTYYDYYTSVGGTLLTYCTSCKKVLSVMYSYPGENHNAESVKTSAPTCQNEGKTAVSCSDCRKIMSETILQKTVHTGESGTAAKNVCTEEGQKGTKCSVCGEDFRTEYSPSFAHKYTDISVIKKVTLTSDGKKKYTCEICGDSFTEDITSPLYCDADLDGAVTASDARLALRAAVNLEKISELSFIAADIDNSGDITASDARLILRISVELDDPETTMNLYY